MTLDRNRKPRKPRTLVVGPATKFAADVAGTPQSQRIDARSNPAATPTVPHVPSSDPQVISRQRTLRAAGYSVAVDGVWGPQSQAAWNSYVNGVRAHPNLGGPLSPGGAQAAQQAVAANRAAARAAYVRQQTAKATAQARAAHVHAAAMVQKATQEAKVQARISAVRSSVAKLHSLEPMNPALSQRLAAKTAQLRSRPALAPLQRKGMEAQAVADELHRQVKVAQAAYAKPAEQMTTAELVATTVDPLTGNLDPSKPDTVKRVQTWLQAHGHPQLAADGEWSKETNAALMETFHALQVEERKAQVAEIATRFYDSKVIVPGQPLGQLAHAPKPGELLSILERGGFAADLLWREIAHRYATSQPAFLAFQENQLDGIEKQLFPAWASDLALSSLGVTQSVEQRVAKLQSDAAFAVQRGDMRSEQAQVFIAKLGALAGATSRDDLQRRLLKLKVEMDRQQQETMHAAMGDTKEVHGFWGHTAHAFGVVGYQLGRPAHFLATGVEQAVAGAKYEYHHPKQALQFFRSEEENAKIDAAVASFQAKHPWIELGLETVLDPMWLVDPISIVTHGIEATSMTALRLEQIGMRMEQGGRLARISAPLVARPGQTVRAFQEAGQGVAHFARGETATGRLFQLDHFYTSMRKLATQKQDALQAVSRRIRLQRRTNFRDLGIDLWGGNVVDGELRFALDKSAPQVQATLQHLVPATIRRLSDNNLSIYSDIERTQDTVIGGQYRAHLMRSAQIAIHQNIAVEEAQRVYITHLFDSPQLADIVKNSGLSYVKFIRAAREGIDVFDDVDDVTAFRAIFQKAGFPKMAANDAAALTEAQTAFKDILDRIDFRGFGGHDVAMAERVKPLMDQAEQDIADTLAVIQDHVEARAETKLAAAKLAGDTEHVPLFDAEGKWVGRGSDVTRHLLSSADEGFGRTVSVVNRAFGKAHTFDEMQLLRQLEHQAAYHSALGTFRRVAGEGFAPSELEKIANDKLDELDGAWERRPDGYYDTRTSIEAPAHYSSHLRDAFQFAPQPQMDGWLPQSIKDILSAVTGPELRSPVAGELHDLANSITFLRSVTGFNRKAAGAAWHDYVLRGIGTGPDVSAISGEFADALGRHTELLDKAEQLVLPRELARDYALWAALAKAQTAPLRVAYKSLSAFLDVWLIATLPLRPGFVVRNVVDNTAKMLADGAIDPRAYFPRVAGEISSVFQLGVMEMREVLTMGGRFQKNPAVRYFDYLIDSFWSHDPQVLKSIFHSHDIEVPASALESMRFGADDAVDPAVVQWLRKSRNKLMHAMANIPENSAKRVLYRDTYFKAISDGATELEAFQKAIDRIDFVLFDYSKVTVLEDNLRFIFPFVQFWRKTATFWTSTALHTPALPLGIDRFEKTLKEKQNADLPEWMRRYVNLQPVAHTLARVPGLEWVSHQLLDGMQTDPMNFFSFNVLYKTFKNENADLPADHAGMKFIGPFVDALNDWGLSMNPLVRKPAEFAGVFNYRAWQSVFPETGLFDAISRQFFTDSPQGFNLEAILEDKVLGLVGYDLGARQRIEQGFNQWVQLEMAAQAERGDTVDRTKAEAKIQHYYVVQTILGFFSGMYARRRDDADIYLYNLQQQLLHNEVAFNELPKKDQRAYELFKRRKEDPIAFDAYLEAEPAVEAYYTLNGTHEQREAFKSAHPEIIPYVTGWKSANVGGKNFVKTLPLLADTETAIAMLQLVQNIDADFSIKQAARQMFVSRELQAFWDGNDTPDQVRDKMLQGELHAHINSLQKSYFAIPESDHEAQQKFLEANPLLGHSWEMNNSHSDDLKSVMNSMNATLRDRYFEYLDAKDYAAARDFLHRFPFIFEFTKSADKVNANGDWISFGGHKGQTEHSRDYLAAKPYLDHFFALMDGGNKQAAFAYANKTPILSAYFHKWGKGNHGQSQHAHDYLAIKSQLQWFFNLLKTDNARAQAWLDSDNPDAKKVRDYFRKYASHKGMTQHGLDYAKVKSVMTRYFDLQKKSKDDARAFLKAHPELEAYFKKYGHFTKVARKWKDLLGSNDPAINARLDFWKRYWTLEPDARPAFVAEHADDAGVFIYGSLSAQQREDSQREYLRQAMARKGMTKKMALYLHVKPLLDLYYTLSNNSEKDLFLRANPDVQNYLDAFGGGPKTGDKKLDGLIESYFQLDRHSADRSKFLHDNPKLQAYFDKHSSPADRAIRETLNVYFKFPPGKERSLYSAKHPEIQAYFDQRKVERDNELQAAMAFDVVDPRVAPFLQRATAESGHSAETMLRLLRESVARNKFKDGLSRRVDRAPTTP